MKNNYILTTFSICFLSFLLLNIKGKAQNIGIGTTLPTAKLHIFHNSSTSNPQLLLYENSMDYSRLNFMNASGSSFWAIAGANSAVNSNARLNFYNSITGDIMSITGNGNVGIGTSSPTEKLEINGNLQFSPANPFINSSSYITIPGGAYFNNGTVYIQNQLQARGGVNNDQGTLTLTGSNGVVNSASTYFNVTGKYTIEGSDDYLRLNQQNSYPNGIFTPYNLTVNGKVGIGLSTPTTYPLDVAGYFPRIGNFINSTVSSNYYGVYGSCNNTPGYGTGVGGWGGNTGVEGRANLAGSGYRYGIYGSASGGNYPYGIYGSASGGDYAYGIYGSASGATTDNYAGFFSGNVYTTGSYLPSDRKLKNDIKALSGALSIINQLSPSVYTYKTNEYKQMQLPEGVHYGLIADEVHQVLPDLVKKAMQPPQYENHDERNGKKLSDQVEFNAVNYSEMIPILIGAVKEQQAMIDELKMKAQKIDQQQAQINSLQKEIELIKEKLK